MKIGRVRAGERFVFDHIGGVYQKVSADKARCIYGKHFGAEEPITPDISVYVIFEDRDKMKNIGAPREESEVKEELFAIGSPVVNTAPFQQPVCEKCGLPLIGKPLGCPTCSIIRVDLPGSSQDARVVPVDEERVFDKELLPRIEKEAGDRLAKHFAGVPVTQHDHPAEVQPPLLILNTMKVVVLDGDEKVLLEIPNATDNQITAFANAEGVRLHMGDTRGRIITESYYDYPNDMFCVIVGGVM